MSDVRAIPRGLRRRLYRDAVRPEIAHDDAPATRAPALRRLGMASRARGIGDLPGRSIRGVMIAAGLAYLAFGPGSPTSIDWGLGGAALALVLAGGRWPVPVAVLQAGVLTLAELFGTVAAVVPKVAAGIALAEVVLHRPRRWVSASCAAAVALGYASTLFAPSSSGTAGVGSLLYRIVVGVIGPILIGAYLRSSENERRAARALAADAERRREMAAQTARQAERAAIARELHDIVAHHVASMVLRVGIARRVLPHTDARMSEVLDDVHDSAMTALGDVRRLLTGLRADADVDLDSALVEPHTLPDTLTQLVDRIQHTGAIVNSSIVGELGRLDTLPALTVLRITQEGLTNAVKHGAPGGPIDLRIEVGGDGGADTAVCIEVSNPVRTPIANTDTGHGLLGMHERASLLGGTLTAGLLGGCWVLRARIPQPSPNP